MTIIIMFSNKISTGISLVFIQSKQSTSLKCYTGNCSVNAFRRLHGQVLGVLDLKSCNPEFKSGLDYQLDLFQVVSSQLLGCVKRYGYHQRENNGSRLFTDVKPCWMGLIFGWVTI